MGCELSCFHVLFILFHSVHSFLFCTVNENLDALCISVIEPFCNYNVCTSMPMSLCYSGNRFEVKWIAHHFFPIGLGDGATTNFRPVRRLMVFTDCAQCDFILSADRSARMSP